MNSFKFLAAIFFSASIISLSPAAYSDSYEESEAPNPGEIQAAMEPFIEFNGLVRAMIDGYASHGIKYLNSHELVIDQKAKTNTGNQESSQRTIEQLRIKGLYRQLFESVRQIPPQAFIELEQAKQIAFWVNLYNTSALYLMITLPLSELFPSLYGKKNVNFLNSYERQKRFLKDPFFTKRFLNFTHIGPISLNDIAFGILGGEGEYFSDLDNIAGASHQTTDQEIKTGENPSIQKADTLRELNEAIYREGQTPYVEPLFLLMSGHNIMLTLSDIDQSYERHTYTKNYYDLFRWTGIEDVIYYPSFLENLFAKTDKRISFLFESPVTGNERDFVHNFSIPYILIHYQRIIECQYGSVANFLLRYVPNYRFIVKFNFGSPERFLEEYDLSFSRFLTPDTSETKSLDLAL